MGLPSENSSPKSDITPPTKWSFVTDLRDVVCYEVDGPQKAKQLADYLVFKHPEARYGIRHITYQKAALGSTSRLEPDRFSYGNKWELSIYPICDVDFYDSHEDGFRYDPKARASTSRDIMIWLAQAEEIITKKPVTGLYVKIAKCQYQAMFPSQDSYGYYKLCRQHCPALD